MPRSPQNSSWKLKEFGDCARLFGSFSRTQALGCEGDTAPGCELSSSHPHPGQASPPQLPARCSASFSSLPPLDKGAASPWWGGDSDVLAAEACLPTDIILILLLQSRIMPNVFTHFLIANGNVSLWYVIQLSLHRFNSYNICYSFKQVILPHRGLSFSHYRNKIYLAILSAMVSLLEASYAISKDSIFIFNRKDLRLFLFILYFCYMHHCVFY